MKKPVTRNATYDRKGSGSFTMIGRVGMTTPMRAMAAVVLFATLYSTPVLSQTREVWVHTTVADFSGCGISNGASVTNMAGGEVRLLALVEDYFDEPSVDTARWIVELAPGSVVDGVLTIDQSWIRSVASVGQGDFPVAVEGRIRFAEPGVGTGWGDFGLGKPDEVSGPPNALFITDGGGNVYANDYQPGTSDPQRTQITGFDWTEYQDVRFVLFTDRVDYYINDILQVTHSLDTPMTTPLYLWFYSLYAGFDVSADWLRVSRYPANDQYTSCPFDVGRAVSWGNLLWQGDLPAGTSASFETRSSGDGESYSDWTPLGADGEILSPIGRYLQYRISLSTSDPILSPQIDEVSITIGPNSSPTAYDQTVSTQEDTAVAVTLTASDADGDALIYSVVDGPTNGALSGEGENLTYTPDADYNGVDSFTFQVTDRIENSNIATVNIAVDPVNDPPVAVDQVVSTNEDTPVAVTLTASDVDGDALTYSVVDGPVNGVLSGEGANLTYTPNVGYRGTDSFTFRVNDGAVDSNLATVTIDVIEVNDPPVADDQAASTDEDAPVAIALTASDVDGDALAYSVVNAPGNGALSGTAPNVTYTPDADYNGPDSFTFRVNDGQADSNLATVSIIVNAVNDLPVAGNQAVSTRESTPVMITLTASDGDGDALTYSVVDGPANGVLSGEGANLVYTPSAGYRGTDRFTFRANDGQSDSSLATVTISVVSGNYALSFDGSNDVVRAGQVAGTGPLTIEAWVRPDDANANGLMIVGTDDVNGWSFELNAGRPTLWLSTSQGWQSAQHSTVLQTGQWYHVAATYENGSVRMFVDGLASAVMNMSTLTQGPALSIGGFGSYSFFDGTIDEVRISNVARYTSGFVPSDTAFSPDANTLGLWHFDEGEGQVASDVSPSGNDGTLGDTGNIDSADPTWVDGYVSASNPPVAEGQAVSTNEDTPVAITLTASDVDGDALIYSVVNGPTNGVLSGTAPNVTYTPNADYNGTDSFTFRANDGQADSNLATVSLTVNSVNDPPVAADQAVRTSANTSVAITLTASDVDGDALTYSVVDGPTNGVLGGMAPNVTYTPNADYTGTDSFTFRANDGQVDSNLVTVEIEVTEVNDPPVAEDQIVSTDEDSSVAIALTATDGDQDTLTFTIISAPSDGTLSGTAPDVTYTPDPDYNGPDSFTFRVNDGIDDSDLATVSITVNPVNDAPVAEYQGVNTSENTPVAITLTASDADGDALTYSVMDGPTNGVLSGTAPNVTYTPNAGYNGMDSFTFWANDGTVDSNLATVTIDATGGANSWVHTTVADFSGCGIPNGASVTNMAGGEVRLPALVEDYFDQPTLDTTRWTSTEPATVADGILTADASSVRSVASISQDDLPVTVEGRIRFVEPGVGSGWAEFGFGNATDVTGPPNVLFITDGDGNVYANDYVPGGSGPQRTQITGFDWVEYQDVRFVFYTDRVDYYVNGALQVSHSLDTPMTMPMYLWFYSQYMGIDFSADWLRIALYPTNDQYTSCPVDVGSVMNWGNLTWQGDVLAGTSVSFETRSSEDGQSYSDWEALQAGSGILSPIGRYLQYRISMSTSDPMVSPQIDEVSISTVSSGVPVAEDQAVSTDEDSALAITLTASDVNGDALTYSVVDGPTSGVLSGTAPNVIYTPNADYSGADSFTFRANDGQADSNLATVSITVSAVNDSPVPDDQVVRTSEDTSVTITLTASDADGDALTYSVMDGPTNGVLAGEGATLTYTPNADYTGTDSFTFRANDGQMDSNLATVAIEITEVNDPPVADDQAVSTDEDTVVVIAMTASDVNGDALTYSVVDGPVNGALSGTAPDVTYTPDPDYNGADSFTFRVNDGIDDSNLATVSITVDPVNDAPVVDDQEVNTRENTPVAVTLTASDGDGDALTYSVVGGPANGVLSGEGPNLTYTPSAGYNGTDSFTFRANDGQADSNLATVAISVVSGNYALSFDGSNDVVRAGQVAGTGPLTIEVWVRPDDNNANGLIIVGADDYDGWSLELNGGQLTLWLSTNQGWQYVQHATALQAGQWVHVAVTYENGMARAFVDGIASTVTSVGTLTQGPSLSMGGLEGYPFFDGTIDEVRISNVVRYTSDFVPSSVPFSSDANTLGLWHFDEGAGQTAVDTSTLANDGTLGDTDSVGSDDPTWVEGYPW